MKLLILISFLFFSYLSSSDIDKYQQCLKQCNDSWKCQSLSCFKFDSVEMRMECQKKAEKEEKNCKSKCNKRYFWDKLLNKIKKW